MMKPSEMSDQELTRAVAEEVMGWVNPDKLPHPQDLRACYYFIRQKDGTNEIFNVLDFYPLTNANHWWMLVREMVKKGYRFEIDEEIISFWPEDENRWEAGTTARIHNIDGIGRAVCEAALAAKREKL